jgi:hypothetical protein
MRTRNQAKLTVALVCAEWKSTTDTARIASGGTLSDRSVAGGLTNQLFAVYSCLKGNASPDILDKESFPFGQVFDQLAIKRTLEMLFCAKKEQNNVDFTKIPHYYRAVCFCECLSYMNAEDRGG